MAFDLSRETLLRVSIGSLFAVASTLVGTTYWVSKKISEQEKLLSNVTTIKDELVSLTAEHSALKADIAVLTCKDLEVRRVFDHNLTMWRSLTTAIDLRFGGDPSAGAGREHITARMSPLIEKAEDWNSGSNC